MSSVFVLAGRVSFSHETMLGVYSSKEEANHALEECYKNDKDTFENYDSFHCYEKEINSPVGAYQREGFSVIPFEKNKTV